MQTELLLYKTLYPAAIVHYQASFIKTFNNTKEIKRYLKQIPFLS